MSTPLSVEEWEKAMEVIIALQTEIPADGGWVARTGKPEATGPSMNEIPNNHPSGAKSPVTPADKPVDDEIPAGGGFAPKVGKPEATGPSMNEIPNNHPAGTKSPVTPLDWAKAAAALNMSDTSKGWQTGKPLPTPGSVQWVGSGPKTGPDGTGPDGSATKSDTLDRAPRSTMAKMELVADEDLDKDVPDNLSLPDGTFLITNKDDLQNSIDKVKNADQANPRAGHPWYMDVKHHIARRAAAMGQAQMVPNDWQLSMAALIDAEWSKDYDAATRKQMAKEGKALPNGSYPIANVSDLKNAMILARSGHGDVAAAKAHIKRRAKALGVSNMAKGL